MDPQLLEGLRQAVPLGTPIPTVTRGQPNTIVSLEADGAYVTTARTQARGTGPQLVPAWMIQAGWDELSRTGRLEQEPLRNELGVKRSAFVMAALSRLPEVEVVTQPQVALVLRVGGRAND
jgi:hypothetical protein